MGLRPNDYEWTSKRVEKFKALFFEGVSFSQIAAAMGGVSRNACIGKAHRLKLPPRGDEAKGGPRLPKARKPDKKLRERPIPEQICDLPPDQSPFAVSLLEIRDDQCHWPLGEPKDLTFCGAAKLDEHSYCERHCRMAYRGRAA